MLTPSRLLRRVRSLFSTRRFDEDLDEELRFLLVLTKLDDLFELETGVS